MGCGSAPGRGLGVAGLAVIVLALCPHAGWTQESRFRLIGVVHDTAGIPLESVLVYIDTSLTARTNQSGDFVLPLAEAGAHVLHLRRLGFAPRNLQFTPDVDSGELDVGLITLHPGAAPVLRVTGRVRNGLTGEYIVAVAVGLNAETHATTDHQGVFRFRASRPDWGPNLIEVRRIGFEDVAAEVWIGAPETTLDLTIDLLPLPFQLAEVVVEGDRTIYAFGRMADFYRRRRGGFGHFFTSADIERRRPLYMTDMLRLVPGFTVTYGSGGSPILRSRRGGGWGGGCYPVVFVDGMRFKQDPDMGFGIDDLVPPDHVAGIEVYSGPATAPTEFYTGDACGAVVIWTK